MSQFYEARRWAANLHFASRPVLLAIIVMVTPGCAIPEDPSWMRPGSTPLALEVDKATCKTQSLVSGNPTATQLDIEVSLCLRQLGWYRAQ